MTANGVHAPYATVTVIVIVDKLVSRGLAERTTYDSQPLTEKVPNLYRPAPCRCRTVHTGLAVITGTEDRQDAYVALSRGTDVNLAYVFTTTPKQADPAPGPRPAPELARYNQIYPERTGVRAPVAPPAPPGTALAVLVGVLDRDGRQRSATQARNQALADADHLAILHAIWEAAD